MDTKELTAILVVAMVGCVIVAGFMPVLNETVESDTTFTNKGYFYMDKITDSTVRTIVVDSTDLNTILVDNVAVSNGSTGIGATIVCSDNWLIRTTNAGAQVFTSSGAGAGTSSSQPIMTITIEAGQVEVTASSTQTLTFTEGFAITNQKSDWVMKSANASAYMVAGSDIVDSELTAMGRSSAGGNNAIGIRITGTVLDVDISEFTNTSVVFGEPTINAVAIDGYNGLYQLTDIQFTGTINDNTSNVTYNRFIVPAEVTAEKAIHADDNTASIISMVPFILIMGIVLMFIGVVLVRRYV